MVKDSGPRLRNAWLEMRKGIQIVSLLLGILFLFNIVAFIVSYRQLNEAIQNERINSVQQLSRMVSEKIQLLRSHYSSELAQSAQTLTNTKPSTMQEVGQLLTGAEDLYLVSKDASYLSPQGDSIVFSSTKVIHNLVNSDEVNSDFATVQGRGDFWIFSIALHDVVIDGKEIVGLLRLVDAQEYASIAATTLYNDKGFSYVVDDNGVITLRPPESATATYFGGYNILQILQHAGVDEAQVRVLEKALSAHTEAKIVVPVGDNTWLIQSFPDQETRNIVMAIPISVTAQETFSSMGRTIAIVVLTVLNLSIMFLIWIAHYMSANQKMKLEKAKSMLKSDFMNKVSHDIRTPLNAIVGMLELSRRTVEPPNPAADYLQKAKKYSEYLISIINDVLDISRIETGKMRIAHERFDMAELLDTVAQQELYPTKGKKLRLSLDCPPDIRTAFSGDALRIKQCLINLIGNAVKFTPDNGSIQLGYRELSEENGMCRVQFTVEDNGAGMSEEFLERMFKPFEQAESSLTSPYTGSGLGLAIVHNFVTLMNGTITVESKLGEGTKFTLTLPLEICTAEAALAAPPAEESPARSFEGKRLLLAEDNEINREIITELLSSMGMIIDPCENGAQAVAAFTKSPVGHYDMILMDIQMPVMNGLEATAAIRAAAHPDSERIPIVALSANAFEEDVERSLRCGMQAHLIKPIDMDAIIKIFNQYIH